MKCLVKCDKKVKLKTYNLLHNPGFCLASIPGLLLFRRLWRRLGSAQKIKSGGNAMLVGAATAAQGVGTGGGASPSRPAGGEKF